VSTNQTVQIDSECISFSSFHHRNQKDLIIFNFFTGNISGTELSTLKISNRALLEASFSELGITLFTFRIAQSTDLFKAFLAGIQERGHSEGNSFVRRHHADFLTGKRKVKSESLGEDDGGKDKEGESELHFL